jgi:hypothetical protein
MTLHLVVLIQNKMKKIKLLKIVFHTLSIKKFSFLLHGRDVWSIKLNRWNAMTFITCCTHDRRSYNSLAEMSMVVVVQQRQIFNRTRLDKNSKSKCLMSEEKLFQTIILNYSIHSYTEKNHFDKYYSTL